MSEFRRWMILTEAYADSITIGSKAWDIFRNPSRKEYREALADHAMVRAFLVGDDIFVWNVFGAVHRSVRDFMKLPHETIIPLVIFGKPGQRCVAEVTDHVQNTMWAHNGAVAAAIQNHPYMRRMFTKVTVQYYDEDIVGDWQKLDPKLNEGLHDDEPADHGSYGWWIFPDGKVAEMEEAGAHGWIADQWLTSQMSIPEAPYEEAIETLVAHGGVRVATFMAVMRWGSIFRRPWFRLYGERC